VRLQQLQLTHHYPTLQLRFHFTTGSHANEKTCPEYIERAIREAASGSPREDQVDIEIQHVSGSFHLDFIGGFANAYEDVTNVIVRLRSSSGPSKGAILLNSHFDSALGTVAASDDIVQVAIMIEVFRSLVWSIDEKNVDVIFLFNGAEEAILQAAHGFLKHSWASYVSAVINLEAAGSGGREVCWSSKRENIHTHKHDRSSRLTRRIHTGIVPDWSGKQLDC